jgi:hypothetical protein
MVNHYSSLQRILVAIMATMEGVRSYGYVWISNEEDYGMARWTANKLGF